MSLFIAAAVSSMLAGAPYTLVSGEDRNTTDLVTSFTWDGNGATYVPRHVPRLDPELSTEWQANSPRLFPRGCATTSALWTGPTAATDDERTSWLGNDLWDGRVPRVRELPPWRPSVAFGLLLFGAMPFFLGFAAVSALSRKRRRRRRRD